MSLIEIRSELDFHQPTPVRLPFPEGARMPAGPLQVRSASGRVFPAQRDGEDLVALVAGLKADEPQQFRVSLAADTGGVQVKKDGDTRVQIILPDGPFTTFSHDPSVAHPFFYPVLGPGGKAMTRNFPMQNTPGESHDHPHHRSFWSAYGDVNGDDVWSEEPKHGWVTIKSIEKIVQGSMFGGFTANGVWTGPDRDKPLLDSRYTLRVYNAGADRRLLDYDVDLIANYGDVSYGDTKEGGLLSFRVAETMTGQKGGQMQNDRGDVGEKLCWGHPAQWLDYYGQVEGEVLGIAMMDHPSNPNHPCRWHARNYGLVGTNPFARGAFEGNGKTKTPPYVQAKGSTLHFRYRVLMHKGDTKQAQISEAYHAWIMAPKGRKVG